MAKRTNKVLWGWWYPCCRSGGADERITSGRTPTMKPTKVRYPFVPKSTAYLIPGQFWSIPLTNGRFACGRVLELHPKQTRGFLAGLLNWTGDIPPSSERIAGCQTIDQGEVHICVIGNNGGEILGWRPLEEDAIEPWLFLSQRMVLPGCTVQQGYRYLRPATLEDGQKYPVFSWWGPGVIKLVAEHHFAGRER
jgi:hypothetical protein